MKTYSKIGKPLLQWYKLNARELPWRKTKDPYKIWVSEIMLQQTQVSTVIPYYLEWTRKFPRVRNLAKAPLNAVLKQWAGLGYYRRARMLHEGAKELVRKHKGKVPHKVEDLLKIKGIGRYTAGAIASIAYEQRAPIVDGNVIRILTRIYAIKSDIGNSKTIKQLWEIAEQVLPDRQIGDFNQAMMELGALICTPEKPQCGKCPVENLCEAKKREKATYYPVKRKKEALEKIKTTALVVKHAGKVLLQKQPQQGRWGGLYMFPHWKSKKDLSQHIDFKGVRSLSKTLTKPILTVNHGFTKYRVQLEVYQLVIKNPSLFAKKPPKSRWVYLHALNQVALPSPHKRIARYLLSHGQ